MMKKSYIIGVLTIIFFVALFAYTIHIKNVANHYADYINERLDNLIKPSESYIYQADKFIKNALNSKQISTDDVEILASLYGEAVTNIESLESIELFVRETQQFGEPSKRTLFTVQNNIRNLQSKGKVVELTSSQMKFFQEINKMNRDLLTVLKPTLQQQYQVKEDHWITVLKQMDNVTQKYYDLF